MIFVSKFASGGNCKSFYIEEIMTLQKTFYASHLLAPFLLCLGWSHVWARKSLNYWQSFTISFIPLHCQHNCRHVMPITIVFGACVDQKIHSKTIKKQTKSTKSWIL